MLAQTNRPSPFLPIISLQTQQFHAITHSFAQRQLNISIVSNALRTLSVATGVVPPLPFQRLLCVSAATKFAPPCFHNDTNCFSGKPFILTTIRIARGWGCVVWLVVVAAAQFADDVAYEVFGVAEEHQRVVEVVQRGVDAGEAGGHAALDDHDS